MSFFSDAMRQARGRGRPPEPPVDDLDFLADDEPAPPPKLDLGQGARGTFLAKAPATFSEFVQGSLEAKRRIEAGAIEDEMSWRRSR